MADNDVKITQIYNTASANLKDAKKVIESLTRVKEGLDRLHDQGHFSKTTTMVTADVKKLLAINQKIILDSTTCIQQLNNFNAQNK